MKDVLQLLETIVSLFAHLKLDICIYMYIYVYASDHGNAHVNVIGPGAEAKIFINDLEIKASSGFSEKALTQIVSKVEEFQELLLEAWESYHGEKED